MQIHSIDSFLEYFEGIRARTRRVVLAIPPERIDWSPGVGRWSFGDVVRHLAATERYMFIENALLRPSRYSGHGREHADGFGPVLAWFDQLHRESVELMRPLTSDDLQRRCTTPAGTQITVWKWLRAMVEHEVHHRGQLYLMLSLAGEKGPPLFGLSEEEVRERAKQH